MQIKKKYQAVKFMSSWESSLYVTNVWKHLTGTGRGRAFIT